MGNKQDLSIIALFIILIFGFTIATMLKTPVEFSETENRMLAQKPEEKIETILNGEFEADYEEYLMDQFVWREGWIGLKTSVERLLLKRESKDIYFGEDGYLIEKHTGVFASDMAVHNIELLAQAVARYMEQLGPDHITVMMIPDAVEILQDKLPPFAPPSAQAEYLSQVEQALPEKVWLDAAKILRQHKEEALYYRTDHHWKTLAAFYVYQEWADAQGYRVPASQDYWIQTVTDSFEGTIQSKLGIEVPGDTIDLFLPKNQVHYTVQKEASKELEYSIYEDSALDSKDQYAVYFGGNQGFVNIRTSAEHPRNILVIKDSYANCFIPFMIEEFQVIDILDPRYDRQRLSERILEGEYTDLLFLYHTSGFAQDSTISRLLH